jgi:hypothetical protein
MIAVAIVDSSRLVLGFLKAGALRRLDDSE